MQISSAQFFVFVEGKTDRYFYNKVCERSLQGTGVRYQIRLAQELPRQTGGKQELLRFFHYLRRRRALHENFKGQALAAYFFLDKDIDDLTGTLLNSNHLLYTEHYQIENYFFVHGDLVEAAAVASTLNHADIRQHLGMSNQRWRRGVAESWKDWIKLCAFTVLRRINYDCSFSVPSRINAPYGPILRAEYERRLVELENRSGLTHRGFIRAFNRVSDQIDEIYTAEEFDKVFKGKWYATFLSEDIRRIAGGRAYDAQHLPDKLLVALALTINFDGVWLNHFRLPIQAMAAQL